MCDFLVLVAFLFGSLDSNHFLLLFQLINHSVQYYKFLELKV